MDDVAPDLMDSTKVDGKLYGLPFSWNNMVMWYSPSRVKAAGLDLPKADWTKDDFVNYAKKLTGENTYGYATEIAYFSGTWPKGGKPTLPFVYSDEVWTGIEYQVASHLISEGLLDESLTIVKAVRSRYEGHTRNPWNEYECGSYYARAMASYALLPALSGFRYSMPEKRLYFGPKLDLPKFRVFFSTASGWGTISLSKGKLSIDLVKGDLVIDSLVITLHGKLVELTPRMTATASKISSIQIS